jgi:hypothetical protein
MEDLMAVLPYGFHHHERGIARDGAKDLHSILLAIDEPMAFGGVEGMTPPDFETRITDRLHDGGFRLFLGGPAHLIRSQP